MARKDKTALYVFLIFLILIGQTVLGVYLRNTPAYSSFYYRIYAPAIDILFTIAILGFIAYGIFIKIKSSSDVFELSRQGRFEKIKELIMKEPDLVNKKDKDGITLLHIVALSEEKENILFLLSHGADINAVDNFDVTPLMLVSDDETFDSAVLLLEKGARTDLKDKDGNTALHYAANSGSPKTLELLLSKGMDINQKNNEGGNLLHEAVRFGYALESVKYLISKGVEVNELDNTGRNPLHVLLSEYKEHFEWEIFLKMTEILLSAGVYTDVRDKTGRTPVDYAKSMNKQEILDKIKQSW
jgi:ankyrin repeat protein